VFITAVPITKLFAWQEGDSGLLLLQEQVKGIIIIMKCFEDRTDAARGGAGRRKHY
jgi:hypothetical protein